MENSDDKKASVLARITASLAELAAVDDSAVKNALFLLFLPSSASTPTPNSDYFISNCFF